MTPPPTISRVKTDGNRLRELVLESAITLRDCARRAWSPELRRSWRSHMREEALTWRRLARLGAPPGPVPALSA